MAKKKIKKIKRKKIFKKKIDSKMKRIYRGSDNVDMTIMEHSNMGYWKRFVLGIVVMVLLIGAAFSVLSLYFFGGINIRKSHDVRLEINAEEQVGSGEDIVYIINYANLSDVSLSDVSINLRYPAGFALSAAIPEPTSANHTWTLGDLASGVNEQIKLRGRLIGERDESKTVTAVLSYTPQNFNSKFQEITSFTAHVDKTDLSLDLDVPKEVFVGEKIEIKIDYESESGNDLEMVRFEVDFPKSFTLLESDPAPVSDQETKWDIHGAYKDGSIIIQGLFSKHESEGADIIVRAFLRDEEESFYLQNEFKQRIRIMKSDALVGIVVNGAYESKSVSLGDMMNYKLSIKNESDAVFEDIIISLNLISKADYLGKNKKKYKFQLIDWDSLKMANETKIIDNSKMFENQPVKDDKDILEAKVLRWTNREFKDLEEIAPDEEKEINLAFNLIDVDDLRDILEVYELGGMELESYVEVMIGKTGGKKLETEVQSNVIVNRVHSDLSLKSEARYYDDLGLPIGQGPLPPKVGQKTTYQISWELSNSVHELTGLEVSVILPEYVQWGSKQDLAAGELDYNYKTRVLKWKINRMPVTVSDVLAKFEVSLLPGEEHSNQILVLVPKAIVKATDSYIKSPISVTSRSLTTNLEYDENAQGKGIVKSEDDD